MKNKVSFLKQSFHSFLNKLSIDLEIYPVLMDQQDSFLIVLMRDMLLMNLQVFQAMSPIFRVCLNHQKV